MLQHARRPRNVNSLRAAAMLYGDWGTSKAYVPGIAFALAGYSSLPLIMGMGVLTAIVGLNYIWICKHYPDGGGVYSAVRQRSRTLAVIGALLLVADYVVTASLSCLDAFHYLGVAHPEWWAIGAILLIGLVNIVATSLPVIVLVIEHDLERLAALYAIGVIGAITVNLGSCATNSMLNLTKFERTVMGATFALLAVIELTIAYQKRHALIFALSVLAVGLVTRSLARRFGPAVSEAVVERPVLQQLQPLLHATAEPVEAILVAVRGVTETLRFAIEEAKFRNAVLYVLFIREIAIRGGAEESLDQDPTAQAIFAAARQLADRTSVIPLYCVSDDAAEMILDQAATLGVNYLILGSSARGRLVHLLRGNVIQEVAQKLPEEIRLLIHG